MNFEMEDEVVQYNPPAKPIASDSEDVKGYEQQETAQGRTASDAPSASEPAGESKSCFRFFKLDYYSQYFQVSQQQVLQRLKLSVVPVKHEFVEQIRPNPDFYGPFWVLTTIIFLLGSTCNLSRYFYNWEKTEYIFKPELVRYGVILVYSFGFGVPILLHLTLRFLNCRTLSLPELICIYGYSFGCFILVFLLCILPYPWLHWLLMIYGMLNSIAFLVLNLREYLIDLEKRSFIIFGIIGAVQIFLFLMFKLVFYDLVYDQNG